MRVLLVRSDCQTMSVDRASEPATDPSGRRRSVNMREVVNAILRLNRTDCSCRMPPHEFPLFLRRKDGSLSTVSVSVLDSSEQMIHAAVINLMIHRIQPGKSFSYTS